MKFGPLPVAEAEGTILVHSLAVGGRKLKKGRVLSADDISALQAASIETVKVAVLEASDVGEDEAATAIAEAACGAGVRLQAAFTGRCNLYATERGIAVIERDRVDALNMLDEAVTIATVAPFEVVEPGQLLATVKIIPFAAPAEAVSQATAIAAGTTPLVRVAKLTAHRAGLIMTALPDTKASVLDKTAAVLGERLGSLGSALAEERRCPHRAEDIAQAVHELHALDCDPILIFGASAITDRRDEIPAGIAGAGGRILHFGMPVDPGNLLLLASLGPTSVIGLPGCARSPKLNGFDWVLQRLLANIPVEPRDIMCMGAGGLLKEIPIRPQPRAGDNKASDTASMAAVPHVPRIVAIVLAAGQSRRMGARNKLTADVDGVPMVRHAVNAARQSGARETIVVTGHERDSVSAALAGADVRMVHNEAYGKGLSTSLRQGLAAVPENIDGIVVLLGDMPRIRASHIDHLIAAFNPLEGRAICVPTFQGKRGNPVLFAATLKAELQDIGGDVGARHVIGQHEDLVAEVPMPDDAIFLDVDTPDALSALQEAG